jgi:hypothetical protein
LIRDWMHVHFAKQLRAQPAPVLNLRGTPEERLREASERIALLLQEPFDL